MSAPEKGWRRTGRGKWVLVLLLLQGKLGQYLPLLTLCVTSVTDRSEGGRILPDTSARRLAIEVVYSDDNIASHLTQSATLWQRGIILLGWPSFKVKVCV